MYSHVYIYLSLYKFINCLPAFAGPWSRIGRNRLQNHCFINRSCIVFCQRLFLCLQELPGRLVGVFVYMYIYSCIYIYMCRRRQRENRSSHKLINCWASSVILVPSRFLVKSFLFCKVACIVMYTYTYLCTN